MIFDKTKDAYTRFIYSKRTLDDTLRGIGSVD